MATKLSQKQLDRLATLSSQAQQREVPPPPFVKEAELCALFIREFNEQPGWTCYPEACGFDILVVHDDGRQIGVEAKLSLNAKVADQILPNNGDDYFGEPGPDHRLVIVAKITDASAGIAKMLRRLGVKVITPQVWWTSKGNQHRFFLDSLLKLETTEQLHGSERMFDWNPETRCRVPAIVPDLPAGVPSPIKLTPWKEDALRLLALMRRQGFITAKQIASFGHGVSLWTQPNGDKQAWLAKGSTPGRWVETEAMPPFDKHHPVLYTLAVDALEAEAQKPFALA